MESYVRSQPSPAQILLWLADVASVSDPTSSPPFFPPLPPGIPHEKFHQSFCGRVFLDTSPRVCEEQVERQARTPWQSGQCVGLLPRSPLESCVRITSESSFFCGGDKEFVLSYSAFIPQLMTVSGEVVIPFLWCRVRLGGPSFQGFFPSTGTPEGYVHHLCSCAL